MTTPQDRAKILVQQIIAQLHQDFGMTEEEIVELVSEAAYDYFDQLWEIKEVTDG